MLQRKSEGGAGASLRQRLQSVRDDLKSNRFFSQTRTPEQLGNERAALDSILAKVTALETALSTCSTMQRFNETEQANIKAKVEAAKKDLLTAIRDHSPNVFIGKDVVTAAMEFARTKLTAPPPGKPTDTGKPAPPRLSLRPAADADSLPASKEATPKARASAELNGAPDSVFVAVKLKPVASLKAVAAGGISRQSSQTEDGITRAMNLEPVPKPSSLLKAAPSWRSQEPVLDPSGEEVIPKPSSLLKAAPSWRNQESALKPSNEEIMPKPSSLKAAPKQGSLEAVLKPSSEEVMLKPSTLNAAPTWRSQETACEVRGPNAALKPSSQDVVPPDSPRALLKPSCQETELAGSPQAALLKPSSQDVVQTSSPMAVLKPSSPTVVLEPSSQEVVPPSSPRAVLKPSCQEAVPLRSPKAVPKPSKEVAPKEEAVSGPTPTLPATIVEQHPEPSMKVLNAVAPSAQSDQRTAAACEANGAFAEATGRAAERCSADKGPAPNTVKSARTPASKPSSQPSLAAAVAHVAAGGEACAGALNVDAKLCQPGAGLVPLASASSPERRAPRWSRSGLDGIEGPEVGLSMMTLAERIAQAMPANRPLPLEQDGAQGPTRQSVQLPHKQALLPPAALPPAATASRQPPSGVSAGGGRPADAEQPVAGRRRTTPEQYRGAVSPYEQVLLRQSTTAWLEGSLHAAPSAAGTPLPVQRRDMIYHGLSASWAPTAMAPLAPSPAQAPELPAAVAAALPAMQDLGLAGGCGNMHVSNLNNNIEFDDDYETYRSHPEDSQPRRGFFGRVVAAVGTVVGITVVSLAAAFAAAALNGGLDDLNERQAAQRSTAVPADTGPATPGAGHEQGTETRGSAMPSKHRPGPDIMLGRG